MGATTKKRNILFGIIYANTPLATSSCIVRFVAYLITNNIMNTPLSYLWFPAMNTISTYTYSCTSTIHWRIMCFLISCLQKQILWRSAIKWWPFPLNISSLLNLFTCSKAFFQHQSWCCCFFDKCSHSLADVSFDGFQISKKTNKNISMLEFFISFSNLVT